MKKPLSDLLSDLVSPTHEKDISTRMLALKGKDLICYDSVHMALEGVKLPRLKRLWGNYIFEKCLVVFAAERGAGKSYLMMQLCLVIANEYPEFLNEQIEYHGNTLYIDHELGQYLMKLRLSELWTPVKMGSKYKMHVACPQGSLPEFMESLKEKIKTLKPVLVVIDNLKTAFRETNFQDGRDSVSIMTELKELTSELNFTLVVVAHTKKGTRAQSTQSDLLSGSGSISDLADSDFFLRKAEETGQRILKRDKSRVCAETDKAKIIAMNTDSRWFEVISEDADESDYLPKPEGSKVDREKVLMAKQLRAEGKSLREIGKAVGKSHVAVKKWFDKDD